MLTDHELQRSCCKNLGDLGIGGRLGQTRLELDSHGEQASGDVGMIWGLGFKVKLR